VRVFSNTSNKNIVVDNKEHGATLIFNATEIDIPVEVKHLIPFFTFIMNLGRKSKRRDGSRGGMYYSADVRQ